MRLIDDEGNLALVGVNVVDVVVVSLVAVLVLGGLAGAAGHLGSDDAQQLTVVVESTERLYVHHELSDGIEDCDRGPEIEHVLREERYVNRSRGLEYERLRITATVEAVSIRDSWEYDGVPLYIGGPIELDLCRLRIDGTVVDIQEGDDE